MEKQNIENIFYWPFILLGVGIWVLSLYYAQEKHHPDNSLYSEYLDNPIEIPQKGDLYVILNREKDMVEYFKVKDLDKDGQLEVNIGTDSTHLLTQKYTQSDWVINMLSDRVLWDSITTKSIQALDNRNISLKIFRPYQTEKLHFFRTIIFSPWGFITIVILSFMLIWGGKTLSEFLEVAYSIKKEWFEISSIFLLFFFLNPFEFKNWIVEVCFCLLSIVPVYFLVKKKIFLSVLYKMMV